MPFYNRGILTQNVLYVIITRVLLLNEYEELYSYGKLNLCKQTSLKCKC